MRLMSEITGAVVIAATVIGGTAMTPTTIESDGIRVAAFNIQVFGRAKREKPEVMDVLVDIAREFDVMVVQEIRDSSQETSKAYLSAINEESVFEYALVEGPRLGRTGSKEQYAIYYQPARLELLDAFTWPDEDDDFEREPIVATFRSGGFDFTLIACHIKPDDADAELRALRAIGDAILAEVDVDHDLILLGDFNADGSYLDEAELSTIFPDGTYSVLIDNDADTMTSSDNTYDRIIITSSTTELECDFESGSVYAFDEELGLIDEAFIRSVSDHYPVYADFRITEEDDD